MSQNQLFDMETAEPGPERSWHEQMLNALGIAGGPVWPDRFGAAMRSWLSSNGHAPIKTLSLFSGGGGLDTAFHELGFEIEQMVEVEAKYTETLKANSGEGQHLEKARAICADIRDYEPPLDLEADFVIGSPPCEIFSAAGRRASGVSGTSDDRGNLFEEYVRVLGQLQPKGFLFENVYGMTGAQGGEDWRRIREAFEAAGYKIRYRVLDAADYGVPQHRERLFIVGVKEGEYRFPYPTHGPDSIGDQEFFAAGEAVSGADLSGVKGEVGGRYGHLLADIPPGLNYSFYTEKMGHPRPVFSWRSKFSDFLYKADPETPTRTIKAQGGQYTGPFSWENRKFSIGELKRLQTFPDSYAVSGGSQAAVQQIGNSVPPQVGRMLALSVLDQVFAARLPFEMHYMPEDKKLGFRSRKRQLTKRYSERARLALESSLPRVEAASEECSEQTIVNRSRFLSANFGWSESGAQSKSSDGVELSLSCSLDGEQLLIRAGLAEDGGENECFSIKVDPVSPGAWCLGERQVILTGMDLDRRVFTGLWKAFEERLRELRGVADLVQLAGYYQYRSKIKASMSFLTDSEPREEWQAARLVTGGVAVGGQLSAAGLGMLWGVESENVLAYLRFLRSMGYEVRSHSTNLQIDQGEYLIPYAFPTLTPKSVQLYKSLEAVSE